MTDVTKDLDFRSSTATSSIEPTPTAKSTAAVGAKALARSSAAAQHSSTPTDFLSDIGLAGRMQYYVEIQAFAETVVAQSASDFGNYIATAVEVASVDADDSRFLSALGSVGTYLTILDFIANQMFVAALPSQIDSLDLTLASTFLERGEITDAVLTLTASNKPPEITISVDDVVGYVLSQLSDSEMPIPGETNGPTERIVEEIVDWAIGALQSRFAAYAAEHPEAGLNLELATLGTAVSPMTWQATITTPDLVKLHSSAPDLIEPVQNVVNWRASEENFGEGTVHATTATGEDAQLVPGYTGGAFGTDVVASNKVLVQVGGELVLEVDFASTIAREGFNALEARAGYLDQDGNPIWEEGIPIDLIVDGGQVEESSGFTDADGRFITLARLNPESDHIVISVTATGAGGQEVTETVETSVVSPPSPGTYGGSTVQVEEVACDGEHYEGTPQPVWIEVEHSGSTLRITYSESYDYLSRAAMSYWNLWIFEGSVTENVFHAEGIGQAQLYDDGTRVERRGNESFVISGSFSDGTSTLTGTMRDGQGCLTRRFQMTDGSDREPANLTGTWVATNGDFTFNFEQTGESLGGTASGIVSWEDRGSTFVTGHIIANQVVGFTGHAVWGSWRHGQDFFGLVSENGTQIETGEWEFIRQTQ